MTRPLRLEYPGALWHVHNRGVERRDVYLANDDRCRFLELLGSAIADYRWLLHAYVLMSNDFHLLIETMEPTLSRGMQALTGDYARDFNDRRGRVGHLFQGRFIGHLVEKEGYFLELSRYIVLNPVRAKMVEAPGQWPWSSYEATAGLAARPDWLETATILSHFHPFDREEACRSYRSFVAEGIGSTRSPWEDLIANVYLGSRGFIGRVEGLTKRNWSNEHSIAQQRASIATLEGVASAVEFRLRANDPKSRLEERACETRVHAAGTTRSDCPLE
jgi:putative transposase